MSTWTLLFAPHAGYRYGSTSKEDEMNKHPWTGPCDVPATERWFRKPVERKWRRRHTVLSALVAIGLVVVAVTYGA
jgi:hypothetical protein